MPTSQNSQIPEELAKSLESTTHLMQNLLGDLKDNASSLATVKSKLESLSDSVEALSHIVRDGNGKPPMITRLALVEKSAEDIEKYFDEFKTEMTKTLDELRICIKEDKKEIEHTKEEEQEFRRERMLAKLKIAAVVAPGLVALAIVLIKMVAGIE